MNYQYKKEIRYPFSKTVEKIKSELIKENFGIISEMNFQNIFQEKLGKKYENYIILGICNPTLAYDALELEKAMGLFLPCNILIYEEKQKVVVSTLLPTVITDIMENKKLLAMTQKAEEKLKRVIDNI